MAILVSHSSVPIDLSNLNLKPYCLLISLHRNIFTAGKYCKLNFKPALRTLTIFCFQKLMYFGSFTTKQVEIEPLSEPLVVV